MAGNARVSLRYFVSDVDSAIGCYCGQLGFHEDMHPPRGLYGPGAEDG